VQQELAKFSGLRMGAGVDPKAWAHKILKDYVDGVKRPVAVVQMARDALRMSA
jgi:hypothetical protein